MTPENSYFHSIAWPNRRGGWWASNVMASEGHPDLLANVTLVDLVPDVLVTKVLPHWQQFKAPHPIWQSMFGVLYILLGMLSMMGNSLVLWIFSISKTLRSGINILIVNLAFSDLMMMLTQFPILVTNSFNQKWMLGALACEVYGFCGALFGTISIITMTLIAIDRYNAIVTPFAGRRLNTTKAVMWVVGIWVYSLGWCVMPLFGWNQYVLEGFLTSCTFDYLSTDLLSRTYVMMLCLAAYVTPLAVIGFCYGHILLAVRRHDRVLTRHERTQGEGVTFGNIHRREVQLARVVFTSVFFWVVAWTPYAVISIFGVLAWTSFLTPFTTMLPALFAKASAVYNPVIYAVSHPKYRQELSRRFPLLCPWSDDITLSHSSASNRSSTKSDVSSVPFLSRSSSVVSSRLEKAQMDLPSPTTLVNIMAYKSVYPSSGRTAVATSPTGPPPVYPQSLLHFGPPECVRSPTSGREPGYMASTME
ncbi:rhodopsin-like [Oratosquilla oratoria]|uniref:rhodopsin-like n=1 Tax=Oratosquilla oratoria TaxID=337810 RepID=UPI003F765F4C